MIRLKGERGMGINLYTVKSPVMGTFYRASAPGEKPLVEVGQ